MLYSAAAEAGRACMQQELLLFLLLPLLLLLLLCSIWLTERERVLKEKHKFLVKGKWASRVPHITFMAGIFIFIFHICIFAIWHKSLPLWLIRPLCSDTSTTRNCFCCCCSYITFIMRLSLPFSIAFSLSLSLILPVSSLLTLLVSLSPSKLYLCYNILFFSLFKKKNWKGSYTLHLKNMHIVL